MSRRWPRRRRSRALLAVVAAAAVVGPIAWLWAASLVPGAYSVMTMGVPDYGGGPGAGAGHEHAARLLSSTAPASARSVDELTGPTTGRPDVAVTLVARQERFTLATGETVDGYTLNELSPGPLLHARQGDLVQVTLVNESVAEGVTLHWHGVDVPNAEDGVAGVTQDAVGPGERHVYRFVADDAGTYWYHSHQVSHRQVIGGLFGVLVVEPGAARGTAAAAPSERDVVAAVHTYDGRRTVNGASGRTSVAAGPGQPVRVRVVNTDNGPFDVAVTGALFRVVAVDGRDVVGPGEVAGTAVEVAAGGRVDLRVAVPGDGAALVRLGADGGTSLLLGPAGSAAPAGAWPTARLDLLSYGTPAALPFDPERADRRFAYSIGRRPGFVDGVPGLYWTVNGRLFPAVPMFMVAEGDVVRMSLANHSGQGHPMHLHGHHAVVLSRNGVAASGSPWWVDSLEVGDGETYEIAFVADNPGVWMDHCHNLPHAAQGLVAHLMYLGVGTPFLVGGQATNSPE